MKVAILFDNLGPYHHARLAAAAKVCELTAIEVHQRSTDYAWSRQQVPPSFSVHPLWNQADVASGNDGGHARAVNAALQQIRPDVVLVPGWSSAVALAALRWSLRRGTPAVIMSESTTWDDRRVGWKEWAKRRVVSLCATALVGGRAHAEYLVQLGMPRERVFLGYDAVDNSYFAREAEILKAEKRKGESKNKFGLPERYFLASARFVEKKNLARLLQAYALYREKAETLKADMRKGGSTSPRPSPQSGEGVTPWDLVLLGDGPLRDSLDAQLLTFNLAGHVLMPGFKQYPDLPAYYGLASAFIHASTTEQWGLVVNEAMASGLPVLVSNRCGCAPDLIQEGVNGFTFDPCNVAELAQQMLKISAFQHSSLSAFGLASKRIIADWGAERFASGLIAAVAESVRRGPQRATWVDSLLLQGLLIR